jgi:lipoate-protein ligase A
VRAGSWGVERVRGTAAEVHARELPDRFERTLRFVDVTESALVLGSTQPAIDALDIDVVRRRSGGGAVLVGPGEVLWADVFVPADDPLWDQDVGVAFHWLGRTWTTALRSLGVESARSHEGPMVCTAWCRHVCFAGIGPGEVTVDDRKVVGIAQRRTRAGSLFQCAALLRWDPVRMASAVGLDGEGARELAHLAGPLPVEADRLEDAFLSAIAAADGGA